MFLIFDRSLTVRDNHLSYFTSVLLFSESFRFTSCKIELKLTKKAMKKFVFEIFSAEEAYRETLTMQEQLLCITPYF